ncbi:C39 family peptidase [Patescibacteria group bacterium]|nr:C39 family peptidase [Patescibacteria group bacterium]
MRKTISYSLILLAVLLFSPAVVRAEDCDQKDQCSEDDSTCLNDLKKCWQDKVDQTRSEANTLQSAIDIINGQIKVQGLKIRQTVAEIATLEKEITELSERIEGLGISLNRLSEILIKRIRESYKQSRLPYKNNLFAADSFNGFISQYRYVNVAQEQTLDIMKKTELQRLTYNQQKDLKETKQAEVEQKRKELQSQKNILDSQKASKDSLLKETKNNESVYQQKITELNAQLASFSRFASTIGISLLTNQTKCDSWGCYYSQRDSQWGSMYLSGSSYTMASSGCLATSVAMMATHYGKSLTPAQIASSSVFASGDLGKNITVNGVSISRSGASCGTSASCLDSILNEGKPVIVRLFYGNNHFIVIKEKRDGNYIMHDPAIENGNDLNFTEHYSLSDISRIDKTTVQ